MKVYKHLIFSLFIVVFSSCSLPSSKNYDGYTALEIEADKCIDNWLGENDVDGNELKTIFENFYSDGGVSNKRDPIEKQYQDILNFWAAPGKKFPFFKEKKKVTQIIEKLGLTEQDIRKKLQLNCLIDLYVNNKSTIDKNTIFYVFGASLETIQKVPDISPGLLAAVVNRSVKPEDLKKEFYQKTISLIFCFNMYLQLSDN